jgi:hypothetical protein
MNMATFPPKIHLTPEKPVMTYWRLGDSSRVKAYIKAHEARALVLLIVFLIAGTMSYETYQSGLDARLSSDRGLRSISPLAGTNVEQTGSHSSSPTPLTPEFQAQPTLHPPASSPAPQSFQPPSPTAQAADKPELPQHQTSKRTHFPAHRPRHRHAHAQATAS